MMPMLKLLTHAQIEEAVSDFSLAETGFFFRVLNRTGWMGKGAKGYRNRVLLQICLTWLPLFLLSMLQGLAWGGKVDLPFLKDFATHARFLLVLPLLVLAEPTVDARLRAMTTQFFRSGILSAEELPGYEKIEDRIRKMADSYIPDLVIGVLVIVNIVLRWYGKPSDFSYWMSRPGTGGDALSWAGGWYICLSIPVLQYNLLHWIWRWINWVIYYFSISRLPMHLNPAHPDGAGGIGYLGAPKGPFFNVSLAISILFSAVAAERFYFLNDKLADFYVPMGVFAVIIVLLNVLPLLTFTRQLAMARRRGIFTYGALIQAHHRQFDEKWLDKEWTGNLLGMSEASSMIDLNSSYANILAMRFVPFNLRTMMSGIFVSIIPMIPLFAFEYDMVDILKKVIGMFL
jgi:hypothetical protein